MNFIITLIILIIVLGIIVFIHELGHFLAAKKNGVYVHEFAIGMGPEIFSFHRKNDETKYSLRMLPLGGFNALATDVETSGKVKKSQVLENKSFLQRFCVLIMGIVFNFLLAIVLLFINALIYGAPVTDPYIGTVLEGSSAYKAGLSEGDLILSVDGVKINSFDDFLVETKYGTLKDAYTFEIERNGVKYNISVNPDVETNEDGDEYPVFGLSSSNKHERGLFKSIKYAVVTTAKSSVSLLNILGKLITGKISTKHLSGPIGIFSIIDSIKSNGLESLIYLTAYLSVNVGIINFIPLPVFDGGRILLLFIEKIKRKKLNPKVETYLNTIGTVLLILLMIYVTFNDILRLI